jgi:hypothetical protein
MLHITKMIKISEQTQKTQCVATGCQCSQHSKSNHFTEVCFLQDSYFPLQHLTLMTILYGINIIQNLWTN